MGKVLRISENTLVLSLGMKPRHHGIGSGRSSSPCPHHLLLRLTLCIPATLIKGFCPCYHLLYLQHSHVDYPCDYYISSSGLFSNTPSQWYLPWKLHLYLQSIPIFAFSISAWSPPKQSPDKGLHAGTYLRIQSPGEQKGRVRWKKEARKEGPPRMCSLGDCLPDVSGCLRWKLRKCVSELHPWGHKQEAFIDPFLPALWGYASLESPLGCMEIKPVNPKGNQPWRFIGRTDAEAEAPVLWPPDPKSWLTGKDHVMGKTEGRREGDDRGWNGWMASPTQWTWVWANSGR